MKKHIHFKTKFKIAALIIGILIISDVIIANISMPAQNSHFDKPEATSLESSSLSPLESYLVAKNVKVYSNNRLNPSGCYVVANGTKYHTGTCSVITSTSNEIVEMSKNDAMQQGYIACDKCH